MYLNSNLLLFVEMKFKLVEMLKLFEFCVCVCVGRKRVETEFQILRSLASSKMGAEQGPFGFRPRIEASQKVPAVGSPEFSCLELPPVRFSCNSCLRNEEPSVSNLC